MKREPAQISFPLDFRHTITVKHTALRDDVRERKPPGSPAIQRYKAIARKRRTLTIFYFCVCVLSPCACLLSLRESILQQSSSVLDRIELYAICFTANIEYMLVAMQLANIILIAIAVLLYSFVCRSNSFILHAKLQLHVESL